MIDTVDALAARIPDGAMVVVPPDYAGVSLALTRALVARGVRGLHLLASPSSGIQADMLIAAVCVVGRSARVGSDGASFGASAAPPICPPPPGVASDLAGLSPDR